ncbi:MAG: D-alanyl-D-alanine carboxypeptidase family protein [Alphaproteobacteria bacterium]
MQYPRFVSFFCFKFMLFFLLLGVEKTGALATTIPSIGFETQAKQALLIDLSTATVLYEKNADAQMVPSSMTKILTAYVLFDFLKQGKLKLSDTYTVSEKAWRMGGSKMFVPLGESVTLEDLLQGIIVQSGNDACIVAAEGISGSEEAFVRLMNAKAKELGATQTHFLNTTGWPEEGHTTTCWDLAKIAERTIKDFPDLYQTYYAQPLFIYHNIKQYNRNPLLSKGMGDGLKTGHTEEGGYGLVGSGERQGRRLLFVVNGLSSQKARAEETLRLMNWGFQEFQTYEIFKAGQEVEKAEVWMGGVPYVPLVAAQAVAVTVPRRLWPKVQVTVRYKGPVEPPLEKSQILGDVLVSVPGTEPKSFPLVAGASVEKNGVFSGLWQTLSYFLWGEKAKHN